MYKWLYIHGITGVHKVKGVPPPAGGGAMGGGAEVGLKSFERNSRRLGVGAAGALRRRREGEEE